ncbi:M28 family peptidase, partial [Neisseria gonorrhoeae]|uniref:M28 family peptidase n=1 Tax=Neisseria gonorrhoeae TaxID=485 RepID=UPI001E5EA685
RLIRLAEAGIPVEIELETRTRFQTQDLKGYNVVAEIPGTDKKLKKEVVMLGGHLDSWHAATGATDNAAG